MGDACDSNIDRDFDGIQDSKDNCPKIANSDQVKLTVFKKEKYLMKFIQFSLIRMMMAVEMLATLIRITMECPTIKTTVHLPTIPTKS